MKVFALELLKPHFGTNREGKWAIQALQSIPLKPDGSEQDGLFAIKDDLVVKQPAFLGTIKFVLGQSIVPIVTHIPGERMLRCLGTGLDRKSVV